MRRRLPRRGRILKWVGLGLCSLLIVAWGVSLRWWVKVRGPPIEVWLVDGNLSVLNQSDRLEPLKTWRFEVESVRSSSVRWLHGLCLPQEFVLPDGSNLGFAVPLGSPLLILLPVSVALWRHNRRRPPKGYCQTCGYDLTGNVTGVCPECGEAV